MGKKKGKKKNLTAEPWAGPDYLEADAAQEQRLKQLGGGGDLEPEPEPERPRSPCGDGTAAAEGDEGAGAAGGSAGERELPWQPELPWEEVNFSSTQLRVRSQSGEEWVLEDGQEWVKDTAPKLSGKDSARVAAAAAALTTIETTGTLLCTLPATVLGAMANLKELRLPGNALLELPASLFGEGAGLPLLQIIDLSTNRLRSLPTSIVRLPKLQVLNLAANELSSLPEVGCLAALKTLNLTHNKLVALPAALPTTLSVLLAADNDRTCTQNQPALASYDSS